MDQAASRFVLSRVRLLLRCSSLYASVVALLPDHYLIPFYVPGLKCLPAAKETGSGVSGNAPPKVGQRWLYLRGIPRSILRFLVACIGWRSLLNVPSPLIRLSPHCAGAGCRSDRAVTLWCLSPDNPKALLPLVPFFSVLPLGRYPLPRLALTFSSPLQAVRPNTVYPELFWLPSDAVLTLRVQDRLVWSCLRSVSHRKAPNAMKGGPWRGSLGA